MQSSSAEQTYLWNKMVPNFNFANKFNPIANSLLQEAPLQPEPVTNNWGNWPIYSVTTASSEQHTASLKISASSEGKIENWSFEVLTTEETTTLSTVAITTAVTVSATTVTTGTQATASSFENKNRKILEEPEFWRNEIFVPLFPKTANPESATNTSVLQPTTASSLRTPHYRVNTSIGWFVKFVFKVIIMLQCQKIGNGSQP